MSTKDYKTRDEIIVSINKPGEPATGNRRGGRQDGTRFEDIPARRLDTEEKNFRLYDLGQLAAGADIAFWYNANPEFVVNVNDSYLRPSPYQYAADWASFIFGYSFENWAETFKEILDTRQYGFSVNGSEYDAPGENGFPLGTIGQIEVLGGHGVRRFSTSALSYYKITALPDYNAPEVLFSIDESVDIFLTPMIARWTGRADIYPPPRDFSYPKWDYLLNGFYRAIPRQIFLNNAILESHFGQPAFRASANVNNFSSIPLLPLQVREIFHAMHTDDANATLYKVVWNGAFGYRNHESHTIIDPADFPTNETANIYINPNQSPPSFRPYVWIYDNIVPAELFLAAIRKGDEWFFIWNRFEMPLFAQEGYLIAT